MIMRVPTAIRNEVADQWAQPCYFTQNNGETIYTPIKPWRSEIPKRVGHPCRKGATKTLQTTPSTIFPELCGEFIGTYVVRILISK